MKNDTPAHAWKEDPHGDRYNCKRSELPYGNLTDDEFANAMFMCDHRSSLESHSYLDAAKNRIRWLSRQLEKALNTQPQSPVTKEDAEKALETCSAWIDRIESLYDECLDDKTYMTIRKCLQAVCDG